MLNVLYRYKQHKLREFCRRNRPDDEIKRKSYKYDAFVAYCAEDRFWVHDVLMKTLEDVYSFRLCIHYRYLIQNKYVYKINTILFCFVNCFHVYIITEHV